MKKKILVIEDSEVSQAIVSEILNKEYEVFCASTLQEAMRKIFFFRFDLILLDLNLPDGVGTSIVGKMQRLYMSSKLPPIIAVTGDAQSSNYERAYIVGTKFIIKKPFMKSELVETVQKVLDEGHQLKLTQPIALNGYVFFPNRYEIKSMRSSKMVKLESDQFTYLMFFDLLLAETHKMNWNEYHTKYGHYGDPLRSNKSKVEVESMNSLLKPLGCKISLDDGVIELKGVL